ncbi:MAG TPA: hypothetical protein VF746_13555 [Longimicrobium sp.]|jgi:hypothetical protein
MEKLRLDLESLDVQSFDTGAAGTVRAHAATQRTDCLCGQTYDDPLCALTWRCTIPGC